ncbi:MAG: hypothetical protein R3A80_08590 [Bdellovibrionota bacterium]
MEVWRFIVVLFGIMFSSLSNALTSYYATGATESGCPQGDSSYIYAPYDSRCSTHVAADASGVWKWRPDYILGPSAHGVTVTIPPTLAGGIASIKTADGQEFVHAGNHGSAFTLTIHPDTVDPDVFLNAYVTPTNPWGFSECYNPTEEGSHLDNVRIRGLRSDNYAQGHGVSSSRVLEWEAGSGFFFDWFRAKTLFANYWPEILGFDSQSTKPCSPIAGSFLSGVMSRFSSIKNVQLGQLRDSQGIPLANGFSNYITIDRIVFIEPNEPRHKRIGGTEILYLANNPETREGVFTKICTMKNISNTVCEDQSGNAVSWNRRHPVIISNADLTHSIGTIAEEPHWVNAPASGASLRFLNIHSQRLVDNWRNYILSQNWIIEANDITNKDSWIAPRGEDREALAFRTRIYYAVGTFDEVRVALAAIRDQKF